MRQLILIISILSFASVLQAQSISPPWQEAKSAKPGKSVGVEFTVGNNAVVPMTVLVEARTPISNGEGLLFENLSSTVSVRLNQASFKVAPKSTHTVLADVRCQSYPCAVALMATLFGKPAANGMQVAIQFPSIVYICPKSKGCRDTIQTDIFHHHNFDK